MEGRGKGKYSLDGWFGAWLSVESVGGGDGCSVTSGGGITWAVGRVRVALGGCVNESKWVEYWMYGLWMWVELGVVADVSLMLLGVGCMGVGLVMGWGVGVG